MDSLQDQFWDWLHAHNRMQHAFTPEEFAQDAGVPLAEAQALFQELTNARLLHKGYRLTCPICKKPAGALWDEREEATCWSGHVFPVAGNAKAFWQAGEPLHTEPAHRPGSVVFPFNKKKRH